MDVQQGGGYAPEAMMRFQTASASYSYVNDQQMPSTSSDALGTLKPVMPVAPMIHVNPNLYAPPCTPNYAYARYMTNTWHNDYMNFKYFKYGE